MKTPVFDGAEHNSSYTKKVHAFDEDRRSKGRHGEKNMLLEPTLSGRRLHKRCRFMNSLVARSNLPLAHAST